MEQNVTFNNLINDKEIIIPKIQRDYAQGRRNLTVTEIREGFVSSIVEKLIPDSVERNLLLDFVYGSEDKDVFFPLDGQQRLTTLFLFHWYLADDLSFLQTKDEVIKSRFSYHVRTSSKQFCDELVQHKTAEIIEKIDAKNNTLGKVIRNENWFLWEWNKDPTIKSMLTMLNSIHNKIKGLGLSRDLLFSRLKERVSFNLLQLEKYGFTDELYVKMNARGKPLSDFDNLKSTLEEQMRKTNVPESTRIKWQKNFDSNWLSMFWNQFAKKQIEQKTNDGEDLNEIAATVVKDVEIRYLRFLQRIIIIYLFEDKFDFSSIGWEDEDIKNWLPDNDEYETINSANALSMIQKHSISESVDKLIPLFCKIQLFNIEFFDYVIKIFDGILINDDEGISNGSNLVDTSSILFERTKINPSQNLLEAFTNENYSYEVMVQFSAIFKYFEINSASSCKQDSEKLRELLYWARIIRNLTTVSNNTHQIYNYEDFYAEISKINELINQVYINSSEKSINKYLSNAPTEKFFSEEQWKEEKLKLSLFGKEDWETKIKEAENHKYTTGQIRFLLDWSKTGDEYDIDAFDKYYKRFTELFDEDGIRKELSETQLFTGVMLKKFDVDYCYHGNKHEDKLYCLVNNTGKHREYSWKNYLRLSDYSKWIKKLFDEESDLSLAKCTEIASNITNDWRDYIIKNPTVISWIENRKITFFDDQKSIVKLVSKKTLDSYTYELMTFYAWRTFDGFVEKNQSFKNYFNSHAADHKYSARYYLNKAADKWVLVHFEDSNQSYQIETNFDMTEYGFVEKDNHWLYEKPSNEFSNIQDKLEEVLALREA